MGVEFWATTVACASILAACAVVIKGLSQVVTCRLDEPWDIDTQERQRDLHVSDGINYCPACDKGVKPHEIREFRCPCCLETIMVIHS